MSLPRLDVTSLPVGQFERAGVGALAAGREAEGDVGGVGADDEDGRAHEHDDAQRRHQDDVAEVAQPLVLAVHRVVRVLDRAPQERSLLPQGHPGQRIAHQPPRVARVQRLLRPRQGRRDLRRDLLVGVDVDHLRARRVQVLERRLDEGASPPPAEGVGRRGDPVRRILGHAQQAAHPVSGRPLVRTEALGQGDVQSCLEDLHADDDSGDVRVLLLRRPAHGGLLRSPRPGGQGGAPWRGSCRRARTVGRAPSAPPGLPVALTVRSITDSDKTWRQDFAARLPFRSEGETPRGPGPWPWA